MCTYQLFILCAAADAISAINGATTSDDPGSLLEALQSDFAHLENIQEAQAPHYLTLLKVARDAKVKQCRYTVLLYSVHCRGLVL